MKITFLSENKTERADCSAEFGLSIYIEKDDMKILFDTGASDMFMANAGARHVDLSEIDACVISHGHFDHTEGIPGFLKANDHAKVYIEKDYYGTTFGTTDGEVDDYNCGVLWDKETDAAMRPRFRLTEEPVWLTEDVVISGRIPDLPGLAPSEEFYRPDDKGNLVRDTLSHEQILAIREKSGIYLFSGCSHKGIMAAVEYCKTLFPGEHIAGIIAGMHLMGASNEMRQQVIEALYREKPDVIMPVHCTGLEAIMMMKMKFAGSCILAGSGDSYTFE